MEDGGGGFLRETWKIQLELILRGSALSGRHNFRLLPSPFSHWFMFLACTLDLCGPAKVDVRRVDFLHWRCCIAVFLRSNNIGVCPGAVMVDSRFKESGHTVLVKKRFRPPVHQTYAHTICYRLRLWMWVCVCVWLEKGNTLYCQLGMLYII